MKKQGLKDLGYTVEDTSIKGMNVYKNESEYIINHFYIKSGYVELSQNDTNFVGGFQTVQLDIEEVRAILKTMEDVEKEDKK